MPRTPRITRGEETELATSSTFLLLCNALDYESVRVVVYNVGGSGVIDGITVEGSSADAPPKDVDETRYWVQLGTISDFLPAGATITAESAKYMTVTGPWNRLRVRAKRQTAAPTTSTLASCDVIGTPWSE